MYVYGYQAPVENFDTLGGYGSWFSRAVSSVGHAVAAVAKPVSSVISQLDVTDKRSLVGNFAKTTVGKILLAPVAMPFAETKALAWVGSKTGIKPLQELDSQLGRVTKNSPIKGLLQTNAVAAAAVGAAALTVVTGGGALALAAAVAPSAMLIATNKATYGGAVNSFVTGSVAGLTAVSGSAASTIKGITNSVSSGLAKAPMAQPQVMPVAAPAPITPPAPAAKPGLGGPAAGAAAGFLLGGPVGAAVGAAAGFWISRNKV